MHAPEQYLWHPLPIRRTTLPETAMAEPKTVEIAASDLPLCCPPANAPVWNQHPRVYLDVLHSGEATCPYCEAHYVFKGEAPTGH